jgi:hypothetical protein
MRFEVYVFGLQTATFVIPFAVRCPQFLLHHGGRHHILTLRAVPDGTTALFFSNGR